MLRVGLDEKLMGARRCANCCRQVGNGEQLRPLGTVVGDKQGNRSDG